MNITRRIVFHAGHMLKDDTSKCYHPHGHEYVLEVTLAGPIQEDGAENGMVMNFGALKDLMMEVHDAFDHKFIIEVSDPRFKNFVKAVGQKALHIVDHPPTAEHLVQQIYGMMRKKIPKEIIICNIKLQETYQCWAEYKND